MGVKNSTVLSAEKPNLQPFCWQINYHRRSGWGNNPEPRRHCNFNWGRSYL